MAAVTRRTPPAEGGARGNNCLGVGPEANGTTALIAKADAEVRNVAAVTVALRDGRYPPDGPTLAAVVKALDAIAIDLVLIEVLTTMTAEDPAVTTVVI